LLISPIDGFTLSRNPMDFLSLTHLLLPRFTPAERALLQETDYFSDYALHFNPSAPPNQPLELCFLDPATRHMDRRIEIAIFLLLTRSEIPRSRWWDIVEEGAEIIADEHVAVMRYLGTLLEDLKREAETALDAVAGLADEEGGGTGSGHGSDEMEKMPEAGIEVLRGRWLQIQRLCATSTKKLEEMSYRIIAEE
jgi:hypothetical protein